MNERTHFFIKIYLSHFILERVDVGCVWEVSWRRGQTATYWPQVLLTITALLSHSGWAAQPRVTEGPSPLSGAGSHSAGILSPTDSNSNWNCNWLKPSVSWLYFCLMPTCFRLFTQVHLLIDSSVEGQYVTLPWLSCNSQSIQPFTKRDNFLLSPYTSFQSFNAVEFGSK